MRTSEFTAYLKTKVLSEILLSFEAKHLRVNLRQRREVSLGIENTGQTRWLEGIPDKLTAKISPPLPSVLKSQEVFTSLPAAA